MSATTAGYATALDRAGAAGEMDDLATCCSTASGQAISVGQAEQLTLSLKALADPTRLRLLSLIASQSVGEACVCELTEPVGLSQPTVSHHLKLLVDAGLLSRTQRGRWAYYQLIPDAIEKITGQLRFAM